MAGRWVVIPLILALTAPAMAEEKKAEQSPPPVPLMRIIPGWAQLHSGQTLKGLLLLGGFLGTLTGAILLNHRGNQAYDRYLDCRDVSLVTELRREAESRFRARNWLLVGTALIVAVHLLDLKLSDRTHATFTGHLDHRGMRLGCRLVF